MNTVFIKVTSCVSTSPSLVLYSNMFPAFVPTATTSEDSEFCGSDFDFLFFFGLGELVS